MVSTDHEDKVKTMSAYICRWHGPTALLRSGAINIQVVKCLHVLTVKIRLEAHPISRIGLIIS